MEEDVTANHVAVDVQHVCNYTHTRTRTVTAVTLRPLISLFIHLCNASLRVSHYSDKRRDRCKHLCVVSVVVVAVS